MKQTSTRLRGAADYEDATTNLAIRNAPLLREAADRIEELERVMSRIGASATAAFLRGQDDQETDGQLSKE